MLHQYDSARGLVRRSAALAFGILLVALAAVVQAKDDDAGESTGIQTLEQASVAPVADPAADKAIDGFLVALEANKDVADAERKEAMELVSDQRKEAESRERCITEALRVLHPEFAEALVQLGDENAAEAIPTLQKLAASSDPYLAAEATFYLARAHVMREDFEQALPVLTELTSDKHAGHLLAAGEALFLQGTAQARLLKRKDAEQSLTRFVDEYPHAPERLVVGAKHQLLELQYIDEGSIVDVQDRMDYSRRRLSLQRSDDPTQTEQNNIIVMLEKLIKEAEEKECNCRGSGSGSGKGGKPGGKGGQAPAGGADQSNAPQGESKVGSLDKINRGKMGDQWGGLRDKKREEVLSALKAKFPDRYKELVEQYYKSLQDEE